MGNIQPERRLMIISFTMSISLIGLIITYQLDFLNKQTYYIVSFLRQLIGFIWLAFLPGVLILKILKIYEISIVEKLAYSVGLSLSLVMITGFLINIIYPVVGILKPISLWPLLLTFCGINIIMSVINYQHNKEKKSSKSACVIFNKNLLLYSLLPIIAIIGAKFVYLYNSNIILLCLIILITALIIMLVTTKIIEEPKYPFILYMIALALLLQVTIISPYPMRINVDSEYFYQQLVVQNGYWNYKLPISTNITLSTIMIAPIFSKILNVNVFDLFRYIYPVIFSFVPVILYQIYSKQIDKKCAFLSVCFFLFYLYNFLELPLLRRQQIALLYFTLIILLFTSQNISIYNKKILCLIFTFSLIVSHVSTAIFFVILFLFAYLFITSKNIEYIRRPIFNKLQNMKIRALDHNNYRYLDINTSQLTRSFILFFGICLITWSLYMGAGKMFNTVTLFGQALYLDFFDQSEKSIYISQALGAGFFEISMMGKIYRLLQYLSQIFITIGLITLILKPKSFSIEYFQMAISSAIFLIFTIVAPHLSTWINIFRIYYILLLILSPLCIIGAKTIYELCIKGRKLIVYKESTNKINTLYNDPKQYSQFIKIFLILFLIPYFLYNVGFVFEIRNLDEETSQLAKIPKSPSLTCSYDSGYYTAQEVLAAKKIAHTLNRNYFIYGDVLGRDLISSWNDNSKILFDINEIKSSYHYIFLRKGNIIPNKHTIINPDSHYVILNLELLKNENEIYNNGNALVLGIFS